jgi:hypothetical protein
MIKTFIALFSWALDISYSTILCRYGYSCSKALSQSLHQLNSCSAFGTFETQMLFFQLKASIIPIISFLLPIIFFFLDLPVLA